MSLDRAPHLKYLLMPRIYVSAARLGVLWGLGPVAAIVLIVQALRRRLDAEHMALAVGNAVVVVIALRYMSDGAGVHYYAPASLLAASAMGKLAADLLEARFRYSALALVGVLLLGQGYRNMSIRYFNANLYADREMLSVVEVGKELDRLSKPDDYVVVRSTNNTYDEFWQQAVNYHDPRIFYLSGTRGWAIGRDQNDAGSIIALARRGARFFADPLPQKDTELEAWLTSNAELMWSKQSAGRIWKLRRVSWLAL